jgi:hypothetical protein
MRAPAPPNTSKRCTAVAITTRNVFNGAPVDFVSWNEPEAPNDSGFSLFSKDDPPPWHLADEDLRSVCPTCLIDDHPEAGRGMDLARQHGFAWREHGEWLT